MYLKDFAHNWKYHLSILISAILIIVIGGLIRNSITKSHEESEVTVLQSLQTEVQQLRSVLRQSELKAIEEDVALAAQKVMPAVASIIPGDIANLPLPVVTQSDFVFEPSRQQKNPGEETGAVSGLLIDADGHIITTADIDSYVKTYQVSFDGTEKLSADLVGVDHNERLALLKLKMKEGLPALPTLAPASLPKAGGWLLRLGRAPGNRQSISLGLLSAVRPDHTGRDSYILDAEMSSELDGGPSINLDAAVTGINIRTPHDSRGYTIPIERVLSVANRLKSQGFNRPKSWIGVELQDITDGMKKYLSVNQGAFVTRVNAGSPALRAGLQPLDVVTKVNEKQISSAADLINEVHKSPPGTKLKLSLLRSGYEKNVEVETYEFVVEKPRAATGQTVDGIGLQFSRKPRSQGVEVAFVQPGSVARKLGLQAGDLILTVNDKSVGNFNEFQRIQKAVGSDKVQLWLIRRGDRTICITVGEGVKVL